MTTTTMIASEWQVDEWLNAAGPITLASLRGRVVVMLAFQMLCPGCVAHALPLATRVHHLFPHTQVAMLGLHTVFEHHEAMSPVGLRAFMHEYRIPFPVGIDRPGIRSPIPDTMRTYAMRGTPTWLLYDTAGQLRQQFFGDIDGLRLGAEIMCLIADPQDPRSIENNAAVADSGICSETTCPMPDP
jgi:hypothetical protein